MRPVVLALGGNALIRPGEEGTSDQQWARADELAAVLAELAFDGVLVITHGNGPQVGRHLLRSELCAESVPGQPLHDAVAATQGEIGAMLQQTLGRWLGRPVVTVVTHVMVDADDPALRSPTKFVGRFYDRAEAERLASELGWVVHEDRGRGWRRVVPSPAPVEVVELAAIQALVRAGVIVVACGGGGVPLSHIHGRPVPVEAVVDKDAASALLANRLGAPRLVVLTGVDEVMVDYGTPEARPLRRTTASELRRLAAEGQFPEGSMGPKIRAALDFLEGGGREVLITSPEALRAALSGHVGTRVTA